MIDRPTRDDERQVALDVAVRPIAGGAEGARRARRASLATIGIAVAVVLFALPKGEPAVPNRPGVNQAAQTSPEASVTRVPPTPVRASPRPTLQPLPEIPNEVLFGAPHPSFYERRRDDLVIREWTPGDGGLEIAATIVNAFADMPADAAFTQPSPDGRSIVILRFSRVGGEPVPVRLVTDSGGVVWEGMLSVLSQPIWSIDSRFVAMSADEESWWLIDTAADPPGVLRVAIPQPPIEADPSAEPSAEPLLPNSQAFPIAFAADVSYLYGASEAMEDGSWRSPIRVAVDSGEVEPIDELPTSGPQAPASLGNGFLPDSDPASGRTALYDQIGPVVRERDGSVAFRLDVPGAILAMIWAGDGRLITVETEGRDEIGTIRVTPWTADGVQGPPLLVSSHPAWVPLTEHRDGHLLMGFVTDFPSASNHPLRLVLLRLDDGATATTDIDTDAMPGLIGLGWYEPRDPIVFLD